MISLRQLRYLDALAVTGHFGRAAELAGISQPALSMQIRDMEIELGGALVERKTSGATLTPLGQEVAARARNILVAIRDLQDLGHAHGGLLEGPLALGVIPSVAPYLLPGLLAGLQEHHPRLKLTVRESVTRRLVEELAAGSLDAIIVSVPLGVEDFVEAAAFDDPFLLAAPAGSPLADRPSVLTELIEADELLLLEDGHCLREQALQACHAIDQSRLRSFGATSLSTLLQLVAAGQGVTLVPSIALASVAAADPRLRLKRFADPEPHRRIGLAWRKSSPREQDFRALVDLIRQAAPARLEAVA